MKLKLMTLAVSLFELMMHISHININNINLVWVQAAESLVKNRLRFSTPGV